jgi:uncharacterized membrane protein
MTLSPTGESRINGYLFVLERSLKTFLPSDTARDAVREIESHVRERIAGADAMPNERDALERILADLGSPMRVAQAYSAERTIEEAVTTGRFVPIVRAIWQLAATTVRGFFVGLGLFIGYVTSIAFFALATLKPIFPENVGFQFVNGVPMGMGVHFPRTPDLDLRGGYWVVPVALFCGMGIFIGTHRGARRYLAWWRAKRQS